MNIRGFTLVEVLIVVIVLGILAAVVIPQFADATGETYDVVAKSFHRALTSGIAVYLSAQKKFPSSFWSWVVLRRRRLGFERGVHQRHDPEPTDEPHRRRRKQ